MGQFDQVTFPVDHHQGSSIGPGTLNIWVTWVTWNHPGPRNGLEIPIEWWQFPNLYIGKFRWKSPKISIHDKKLLVCLCVWGEMEWICFKQPPVWTTSILDASAVLVLFFSIVYCISFLSKHMGSSVLPKNVSCFLRLFRFHDYIIAIVEVNVYLQIPKILFPSLWRVQILSSGIGYFLIFPKHHETCLETSRWSTPWQNAYP